MAFDAFLKIDGIDGESQDAQHKGSIDVLSFSWGETRGSTVAHGSGGGAGKVSFQDLHFTMKVNVASPKLMLACATGKHIPKATLVCRQRADERNVEFLKFTLTDVLVSSYETRAGAEPQPAGAVDNASLALTNSLTVNGDGIPVEKVSLNFARIEVASPSLNVDGSSTDQVLAGWDLRFNRKA